MDAQPAWGLVEVSQRRKRDAPEALDEDPRCLWLGHRHAGVGEAEGGLRPVGSLGSLEGAKVIRILTPVASLLPRRAEAVFLGAVCRDGGYDGPGTLLAFCSQVFQVSGGRYIRLDHITNIPLIPSGQDNNGMGSGFYRDVTTPDKVVVVPGTERRGRLQEGDVSLLPVGWTAFAGRSPRVAMVRHTEQREKGERL